jgi:hypothetical protein
MRYRATVVDTQHHAWEVLANDKGELAGVVYALVEHDAVELDEREADLLRTWLRKLGAGGIVNFEEIPIG